MNRYDIRFDYLRCVAMLGVLAVHLSQHFPTTPFIKSVMVVGMYGVQMFFVISAWLGCESMYRQSYSLKHYYCSRALRILPIYYAAIIAAMLYVCMGTNGFSSDIFHLGWFRYFLGLNTILPSASFWQWNNAFAFWTMSEFIYFYISLPFIIKLVNSWNKSILFFLLCVLLAELSPKAIGWFSFHYGQGTIIEQFSEMVNFIGYSPLCQMQYFALGILGYFAIRDNKKSFAVIIMILVSISSIICDSSALLIAALTCIFILTVKSADVLLSGSSLTCLKLISKYSFHIYLAHMLSLQIAGRLAGIVGESCCFYVVKFLFFFFILLLLCYYLEFVQHITVILVNRQREKRI